MTDSTTTPVQWPSVRINWQVNGTAASPQLQLQFDFNSRQYDEPGAEKAKRDLEFYQQLIQQPVGAETVTLSVENTLVKNEMVFSAAEFAAFAEEWVTPVCTFLANKAGEQASEPAPVKPYTVTLSIDPPHVTAEEFFRLGCWLIVKQGDVKSTTPVTPFYQSTGASHHFMRFATQLESVMRDENPVLRVMQSKGTTGDGTPLPETELWAVRKGLQAGQGINYTIDTAKEPALFAVRPFARKLYSLTDVPVYVFDPLGGIDYTAPVQRMDLHDIDMDVWMKNFFHAVDGVFSPENAVAMQTVDQKMETNHYPTLLAARAVLVDTVMKWMTPVLAGETAVPVRVQEVFRQQLLRALSNVYVYGGAVHRNVSVTAKNPLGITPRLYGPVQHKPGAKEETGSILFSDGKISLKPGTQDLTFLAGWEQAKCNAPNAEIDLNFDGNKIVHQPARPLPDGPTIETTWLEFITEQGRTTFTSDAGKFRLPLPLRSYPAPSAITEQDAKYTPKDAGEDLSALLQWDYSFTYTVPRIIPQDSISFTTTFNAGETPENTQVRVEEVITDVVQFMLLFRTMDTVMSNALAQVRAGRADASVFQTAELAMSTFRRLFEKIVSGIGAQGSAGTERTGNLPATDHLNFEISEGPALQEGVQALTIRMKGKIPAGTANPYVQLKNWVTVPAAGSEQDAHSFYFKDEKGNILAADDERRHAPRTVVLPGLNVLNRYQAISSTRVTRNKELLPGRTTGDAFVYTTDTIVAAGLCTASFINESEVELSTINAFAGINNALPLREHVTRLFRGLLRGYAPHIFRISVDVRCEYPIHPGLFPVSIPVFRMHPVTVSIQTGFAADYTLEAFIDAWQAQIKAWYTTTSPESPKAAFLFDLRLYTANEEAPQELMRFTRLSLALRYITDLRV